jgi:biopolymer transport protein ExbD
MNMSRRAKRMQRHHAARKRPAINLVSLMDIFTILVFFLLVNSTGVQQLPGKKDVKLPTTVAKKSPRDTLVITVTPDNILVQGRQVVSIDAVMNGSQDLISGLQQELEFQASKITYLDNAVGNDVGESVTIMGDENISYRLLRKILATCREVDYTRIAFAATQKSSAEEPL